MKASLEEIIGKKIFRHAVKMDKSLTAETIKLSKSGSVFYSPVSTELSGGTWHKVADPATGWLASKSAGWTANSFTDGLEVDFSPVVPAGTKAVRIAVQNNTANGLVYWRKSGDTNISNTPFTSGENSHVVLYSTPDNVLQAVIWLSADYKAQFTVSDTLQDLYLSYPVEYLS